MTNPATFKGLNNKVDKMTSEKVNVPSEGEAEVHVKGESVPRKVSGVRDGAGTWDVVGVCRHCME